MQCVDLAMGLLKKAGRPLNSRSLVESPKEQEEDGAESGSEKQILQLLLRVRYKPPVRTKVDWNEFVSQQPTDGNANSCFDYVEQRGRQNGLRFLPAARLSTFDIC